jgi:REP element-mobilizing transposase RayT
MARRPRPLAPGLLYHVIARGNQRQKTFVDSARLSGYLGHLKKYRQLHGVELYAAWWWLDGITVR